MIIDDRIYRMITRRGFVELYWEELRFRRLCRPDTTQREVYESLENAYFEEFGERKYPTFTAFRKSRDKNAPGKVKKGKK